MTADVPRRMPPGQEERTRVVATRAAAGSLRGGTRMAKPINLAATAPRMIGGNIEIVEHGADGTVDRPTATWVLWVGAATPSNAEVYDGWYPATI